MELSLAGKVIHLMLDLKIFDHPHDYYLFSDGMKPVKWNAQKRCSATGGHAMSGRTSNYPTNINSTR